MEPGVAVGSGVDAVVGAGVAEGIAGDGVTAGSWRGRIARAGSNERSEKEGREGGAHVTSG